MKDIDTAIKNFPTIVKDGVVFLEGGLLRGAFALAGLEALVRGDAVYAEGMTKAAQLVDMIMEAAK